MLYLYSSTHYIFFSSTYYSYKRAHTIAKKQYMLYV